MYDQSLDPEYYHPAFAMHHNEPKFYDDFNHLNNFMKNSSTLPPTSTNHYHNALPTPPATPDKVPMSYGTFPHPISTQISSQSFLPPTLPSQRNPYSPNGDIQVVPDFFGKEDTTPEGLSYSTHEDAFASTTFAHLQNPHTNIEMPDLGTKRIYSSVNHSSNCQSMEYYMNNNHISANEAAYMRQFAYDDMFNEKRQRFDSTESLEPEFSRAQHNVLERQRRNDLKLRFNILRDNIPELANNEKAPKIQILKKALTYLTILKREEQMLLADKELEKQKKIILMERLKLLKIRN